MNKMTELASRVARSTTGIREAMFEDIERFRRGDVPAGYLHEMKAGFSVILGAVDRDLAALKAMSNMRQGRDLPQSIADLNLNLLLGDAVKRVQKDDGDDDNDDEEVTT